MTEEQREIGRKKRVIEYAERNGNIKTACRRFGIARSTFYLWPLAGSVPRVGRRFSRVWGSSLLPGQPTRRCASIASAIAAGPGPRRIRLFERSTAWPKAAPMSAPMGPPSANPATPPMTFPQILTVYALPSRHVNGDLIARQGAPIVGKIGISVTDKAPL